MRYLLLALAALALSGVAGIAAYARLEPGQPAADKTAAGTGEGPKITVVSAVAANRTCR